MKKVIFIFICLFSISMFSQQNQYKWLNDFNKASVEATNQNKPILIYFTDSKNCEVCKKNEETLFNSSEFKSIASKTVLMLVDRANDDVASQRLSIHYNKANAYPSFVTLDKKGKILGDTLTSFDTTSLNSYINFLNSL